MTRRPAPTLAAFALLMLATAATPAAALTQQEAETLVAERFGVEVLKARPGYLAGRLVWLVTVMNPGADSNSAFVVSTVAVDEETGEPVLDFERIETGRPAAAGPPVTRQEAPATGLAPPAGADGASGG
ncbi:MAG: hypothetical protein WD341_08380 [Tistlia sp.]|uniref:hypothetical protein n=1 Tax=Tistlia sp. TaxID=3057121 RepID=UPI0034A17746